MGPECCCKVIRAVEGVAEEDCRLQGSLCFSAVPLLAAEWVAEVTAGPLSCTKRSPKLAILNVAGARVCVQGPMHTAVGRQRLFQGPLACKGRGLQHHSPGGPAPRGSMQGGQGRGG